MELTANQQLAIDIRNSNVLVSAAAGSGKTSVLVERIVKRVSQEDDPIDIDRLLIMTFTNAAAAEMQSRIRDELEAANLERQSLLVHKALITTIHGFCKSVITDHFEKLSLDPSFRVADENECKLIRQEAGMSYKEYLTGLRIARAKEIMDGECIRIKDVCERVGYTYQKEI